MVQHRIQQRKQKLGQKRQPVQQRSRQRRDEIVAATATLLDQVGFDDLTTTLIARELGISVGSLYHYFPHKQAILHAMGEHWLAEYDQALQTLSEMDLENMALADFVASTIDKIGRVYQQQKGLFPLVQAMYAVPELRDLDEQHDELVIKYLSGMLTRLQVGSNQPERQRLSRLLLEMSHALFITISEQGVARARKSKADLEALCLSLLQRHT